MPPGFMILNHFTQKKCQKDRHMKIRGFFIISVLVLIGLNASWAPDFLIIGAQKSGTTALFSYLNQHPLTRNAPGEVHYFDLQYQQGESWYKKRFPEKPTSDYVSGDKSPYYMLHPLVPQRAAQDYPNLKIIVVLRNPVDRAYSQYWMNRRTGDEKLSFEEAIAAEESRLKGEEEKLLAEPTYRSKNYQVFSYLHRGHYAEQIERWTAHFPEEQFFFVYASELRERPQEIMNALFAFLGLPAHTLNLSSQYRKTDYPPMNPETRRALEAYFKPHNDAWEAWVGHPVKW
jgi:hypothetical protein